MEQVLEELTTMQQFVEQERPGRAEFTVVRDMVLKKLTDELRAAGWTVVADDEGADYLSLAAQLAEQTQPLVQQDAAEQPKQATPVRAEATTPPAQQPEVVPAPALGSVAAAAAAAAAAEKAAAQRVGTAPSTPGSKGYDLNSTLQGLQEMRARLEARRQKRAVEGGGTPSANPSPATSAYQKALLNLKASMSKHGDVRCLLGVCCLRVVHGGTPTTGVHGGCGSSGRCSCGYGGCTRAQRAPAQCV